MPHLPLDDFDHGILSPSGHVSKATRKRIIDELGRKVNEAHAEAEATHRASLEARRPEFLRRSAQDMRDLAARGMQPRKLLRKAAELEAEADKIESEREAKQCHS